MTRVRRPLATFPAAALTALALLGGCGDREAAAPTPTETAVEPTDRPSDAATDEPTDERGPAPSYSPLVAQAVADLAATQGVDVAAIELVAEEEVTWRDGSLGCARRGVMYTQALVEGSRIVLRLDGTDYEYHSGGGSKPFLCPRPTQ